MTGRQGTDRMSRGLATALLWRSAYWRRVAPRPGGSLALGLLPLLFFLPLESVPVFGERLRGVAILIWISSLTLALALRGAHGVRSEESIWHFQKGFDLGELALEDWLLDLGIFVLAAFWWASAGVLAVKGSGSPALLLWLALFSLGATTAALTHSLTLCLSALGAHRPSDLTILLAFVSLLAPILAVKAPGWASEGVGLILPPFRAAVEMHGSIRLGDARGMPGPFLHLLAFSGLVLWIGLARIRAWRPRG